LPVIADATRVARQLNLDYIWIDRFCILQGDDHDWAQHSTIVSNIYTQAAIVISAVTSASPDEPFLGRASIIGRSWSKAETLKFKSPVDGYEWEMSLRKPCPDDHNDNPLDTRGWTFTERLCATRNIRYEAKQLRWECATTTRCESTPWVQDEEAVHALRTAGDATSQYWRAADAARADRIKWHDIVRDYTSRSTTYPSDRLPALSGIAAIVAHHNGDGYLAGLWKSTLISDLTWYNSSPNGGDPCPNAPSWSWASCSGLVKSRKWSFSYRRTTLNARLVRLNCVPATIDPYGTVQPGASITLNALTLDATLDISEMALYAGPHKFRTNSRRAKLDVDDGRLTSRLGGSARPASVPLLLLALEYVSALGPGPALVLRRINSDGSTAVYERVGLRTLHVFDETERNVWKTLGKRRDVTIV
jgi:hypothetical protein